MSKPRHHHSHHVVVEDFWTYLRRRLLVKWLLPGGLIFIGFAMISTDRSPGYGTGIAPYLSIIGGAVWLLFSIKTTRIKRRR